jgi:hypothetical protein
VRNWARAQLGALDPHCKRFFRHNWFFLPIMAENFPAQEKSRLEGGFLVL